MNYRIVVALSLVFCLSLRVMASEDIDKRLVRGMTIKALLDHVERSNKTEEDERFLRVQVTLVDSDYAMKKHNIETNRERQPIEQTIREVQSLLVSRYGYSPAADFNQHDRLTPFDPLKEDVYRSYSPIGKSPTTVSASPSPVSFSSGKYLIPSIWSQKIKSDKK